MKKKLLLIIGILLLILIGFALYKYSEKKKTPVLVNVENVNYVLTDEPNSQKTDKLKYFGKVKNKIKRYDIPKENLESNFLNKGTKIYRGSDDQLIYYLKENKLFIGRKNSD